MAGRLHRRDTTRDNDKVLPRVLQSRRVRIGLLILAIATFYGLMEAVYDVVKFRLMAAVAVSSSESWKIPGFPRLMYAELLFAYLWALACPAVLWVANTFAPKRPRVVRNLLIQVVSAFVSMVVVWLCWELGGGPLKSAFAHGFSLATSTYAFLTIYEYLLLPYLLIVIGGFTWKVNERYRDESLRAARLRTEIVQAQLQAIRMQIHPHFLFNTLHTISALVQESPVAAEKMIARLSDLLRLTLETGKTSQITLGDELRLIELYLEIERTRYEERLAVDIRVPDELRAACVPNFILQPLVENAIKHGIAKRAGRGMVSITAEQAGGNLLLRVRNTAPGLLRPLREGVGVSATRSRLEFLYGSKQQFVLSELTPGVVEASIVLPLATADDERAKHVEYPDADRGRREVGAGTPAPALER